MTSKPVRIAAVMDHPAQQFTRGFQLLAADAGLDVQVYYWSVAERFDDHGFGREVSWDVDLLSGYRSVTPPSSASVLTKLAWTIRHFRGVRPDVLLCYGWATKIVRIAILYSVLFRVPILMYGDTTWQHSSRGKRSFARSLAIRLLLRVCTGAVATGTFNREFYERHGMDSSRVWAGVCPADTETFGQARRVNRGSPNEGDSPCRIGFAGKLIPRKGADVLLQALALLPVASRWSLTIVGDGPLMPDLQTLTRKLGVTDRVVFHGFANTTDMPKLLAGFDIVVVPSRLDMRVLVTIEAMAAGAVLIVSDATAVWGPGDLVQDGVTGLVHASDDPVDLARQVGRLLDDPQLLAALRRRSVERVADFGPAAFATTIAAAAHGCRSVRGRTVRAD
jgi:glycosyltransferase involved in cell wall biosynthesis